MCVCVSSADREAGGCTGSVVEEEEEEEEMVETDRGGRG